MFDKLFQFIRRGVADAVLAGFADAADQLAARVEQHDPQAIEVEPQADEQTPAANGRKRRATVTT